MPYKFIGIRWALTSQTPTVRMIQHRVHNPKGTASKSLTKHLNDHNPILGKWRKSDTTNYETRELARQLQHDEQVRNLPVCEAAR